MALRQPKSMEECVYFTRRVMEKGKAVAWVFREECPACHKALMGKPINKKTGRAKVRSTEYVCPQCNHTVPKQEYEDTLVCNIEYVCPHCGHDGETQVPFKRKKYKGVDSVIFLCEECNEKIPITKKMKEPKKPKPKK